MYNTILSVMHFVDKWLDCPDYDPNADLNGVDAVQRAVKAREIALQAIEQLEAERDALMKDLNGACWACKWANVLNGMCVTSGDCAWQWRGVQKEDCP